MTTESSPTCAYLLLVATETEERTLRNVASEFGLTCTERQGRAGTYLDLGEVGIGRVLALRTEMGPFGYGGSAAQAIYARTETVARSGVISMGMCFGVRRETQAMADVVIASSLVPYDDRDVESDGGLPVVSYGRVKRRPAKAGLKEMLERARDAQARGFKVHVGAVLTGGARIRCRAYRDHLLEKLKKTAADPIVGGEMEGAGLLGLSPPEDPQWILVKGICDFADEQRKEEIGKSRAQACDNAIRFTLEALRYERTMVTAP